MRWNFATIHVAHFLSWKKVGGGRGGEEGKTRWLIFAKIGRSLCYSMGEGYNRKGTDCLDDVGLFCHRQRHGFRFLLLPLRGGGQVDRRVDAVLVHPIPDGVECRVHVAFALDEFEFNHFVASVLHDRKIVRLSLWFLGRKGVRRKSQDRLCC